MLFTKHTIVNFLIYIHTHTILFTKHTTVNFFIYIYTHTKRRGAGATADNGQTKDEMRQPTGTTTRSKTGRDETTKHDDQAWRRETYKRRDGQQGRHGTRNSQRLNLTSALIYTGRDHNLIGNWGREEELTIKREWNTHEENYRLNRGDALRGQNDAQALNI